MFLSLVLGIMLSAILVLIAYFIDDTVSSREDIERIVGFPTIAFIDIRTNATLSNENKDDDLAVANNEEGK